MADKKYIIDDEKLMAEWNHEKNFNLLPSEIFPSSNKKVWWICSKCKHEWQATINNRARKNGTGCPECYKNKRTKK